MKYTVVMPFMFRPFRDECLANCLFANVLEVDNTVDNLGCTRSYNLGVDRMRADDADWLIVLSPAVRFGEAGGLDFIAELERRPSQSVVSAEGVFGWHLIAFARATIEAAGRWDENFHPCYYDDLDYSIRIHKALPDAVWGGVPVDVSDTIMAHSIKLAGLQVPDAELEAYFTRKWGHGHGHEFDEYHDHPFGNPDYPIGYWPQTERGGGWDEPAPAPEQTPKPGHLVGRRVATVGEIEQPGDYCGPVKGYTGDSLACFFLKPNARDGDAPLPARSIQHVAFPPHTYRECADGSLEIRASIGDTVRGGSESDGWHGYLDEGHVWRKV